MMNGRIKQVSGSKGHCTGAAVKKKDGSVIIEPEQITASERSISPNYMMVLTDRRTLMVETTWRSEL